MVVVEPALGPGVAELEERVVVAGVLVVDQPELLAVVDEVAGQQVVVARHGGAGVHGEAALDALELRVVVAVVVGMREAAVDASSARYVCCRANMSKSPTNRGPACKRADRLRDARERARSRRSSLSKVRPSMKPITSTSEVGTEVDDRRADAGGLGRPRVGVLGLAVDAEQRGVAAAAAARRRRRRGVVTLRFRLVSPPGSSSIGAWVLGQAGDLVEQLLAVGAHRRPPDSATSSADTAVELLVRRLMRVRSAR